MIYSDLYPGDMLTITALQALFQEQNFQRTPLIFGDIIFILSRKDLPCEGEHDFYRECEWSCLCCGKIFTMTSYLNESYTSIMRKI